MTLKEAREFLSNMEAAEATQMGLSEGFAADLHDYHRKALYMAIRSLEAWISIKTQLSDEIDFAFADFGRYKMECLGCEDEDDSPNDFFSCGLDRALDIINEHLVEDDNDN